MEAYLDNSATTRCSEKAAEVMMQVLRTDFGNPSSLHNKGMEAENYLRNSRKTIAKTLRAKEKEIIFTSGGTESNNLAIIGTAMARKRMGKHILVSPIEHASVYNPMRALADLGFEVEYLPVDSDGIVDLSALKEMIRPDTILVSIMHVNNEIGAVEPIEEAAKIIKAKNPQTYFHVDAIQSYGKFEIYPDRFGIDLLSVSGHKIHGPKGSGFLFIHEGVRIQPEILGGGQESGMRSGTENVPAIAGLGQAAEDMYSHLDENRKHLFALKKHFIAGVEELEGTHVNGRTGEDSAPQIVSVSFRGVRAEVLLHALEERGVYVSSGSACSSNRPAVSRTLTSIHTAHEYLDETVRFSFSVFTSMEEIDYALEQLKVLLPILRKYQRH
ncbi:MAG: cysteine desulfurase family protein [Lachnospiraceae bacterium]|nr:cysteine desulfurase family protein [Lachnospiraceae bacterium]MDD6451045.1 cysteine desulfurase family protein [Lachnospiraceae bacterium]MDD6578204.1 cysteine desulfurase family protein [Lachnospiraceae bacterium]